ncbi:MAG: hypothetical protein AAFP15_15165 [Bacteroidota bacterium]
MSLTLTASDVEAVEAYAKPRVYLPADSLLAEAAPASPLAAVTLSRALGETAQVTKAYTTRFRSHVLAPMTVVLGLEHIGARLEELVGVCRAHSDELAGHSRESSEMAVRSSLVRSGFPADRLEARAADYAIQDRYFRVIRTEHMSYETLMAQVATVSSRLIHDLPYTVLGREEMLGLLEALVLALTVAQERSGEPETQTATEHGRMASARKSDTSNSLRAFWEALPDDIEALDWQVGHYRWLNGHHFWKLLLLFLIHALDQSEAAVREEDEATACHWLSRARAFLRGTAAAMWYAGDSPSSVYRNSIRPSMVKLAQEMKAKSFSGVQSADFGRMKAARTGLRESVRETYGADASHWPDALYVSMRAFHQTDIHCDEQHVLLAFAKVGGEDPSEAQKMKMHKLPPSIRPQSAVDVLRHMADIKRAELPI